MAPPDRGFMTGGMMVVVALGVVLTVTIPRIYVAREQSRDAAAVSEVHRALSAVDAYRRSEGELPASPQQAGFEVDPDIVFTLWIRQTVSGSRALHLHARHRTSARQFHVLYPVERKVVLLDEESLLSHP